MKYIRSTVTLFLILGLFVALVASYIQPHQGVCMDTDSHAYAERASYAVDHGRLRLPHDFSAPYYMLGYPALLAGAHFFFDDVVHAAVALNLVTLFFFALVMSCAFAQFFSGRERWAFVFMGATSIGLVTFTLFVLSEVSIALWSALSLYALIKAGTKRAFWWAVFGIALGIMIIIKPAPLVVACLLIVLVGLLYGLKATFYYLAGLLSVVMLYSLLMISTFGEVTFTRLAETNWYLYFYPNVRAQVFGTNPYRERALVTARAGQQVRKVLALEAYEFMTAHPGSTVWVWLKNCLKTMLGLYSTNLKLLFLTARNSYEFSFFSQTGSFFDRCITYLSLGITHRWQFFLGLLELVLLLAKYFLMFVFFNWLIRRESKLTIMMIVFMLGVIGVTGHDGCARFRMLIEPYLIFASAGGWVVFFGSMRKVLHG